jgi:hypothetical protein
VEPLIERAPTALRASEHADEHAMTCGDCADRSRRPETCPRAPHAEVVEKIVHLRRTYHFNPTKISIYLQAVEPRAFLRVRNHGSD